MKVAAINGGSPVTHRAVLATMLAGGAAVATVGVAAGVALPRVGAIGVANGALLGPPDANGWRLLAGYQSRKLAVTGQVVPGTGYRWHEAPDGGATMALADGGWAYVSNYEVGLGGGGAGMLRFGPDGSIQAARSLLRGTTLNCSGAMTPWGTYLSCEEHPMGLVWELDPTGVLGPQQRPALGRFQHEGLAVVRTPISSR